jgi:hypothetical protein
MEFDHGQWPTILCINKSTVDLGITLDKLVSVMQKFVNDHLGRVWGSKCYIKSATTEAPGNWIMYLLDDATQAGTLGYHDLTTDGFPVGKVFVKTLLANKETVGVTATHELAEMLLDPAINKLCMGTDNTTIYAWEVCDACEEVHFDIDGVAVSDFVYPAFFEGFRAASSTKFDECGKITQPFQILTGGYMPVMKNGQWTQIFGSEAKAERFAQEDRRGHRSELRKDGGLHLS